MTFTKEMREDNTVEQFYEKLEEAARTAGAYDNVKQDISESKQEVSEYEDRFRACIRKALREDIEAPDRIRGIQQASETLDNISGTLHQTFNDVKQALEEEQDGELPMQLHEARYIAEEETPYRAVRDKAANKQEPGRYR